MALLSKKKNAFLGRERNYQKKKKFFPEKAGFGKA